MKAEGIYVAAIAFVNDAVAAVISVVAIAAVNVAAVAVVNVAAVTSKNILLFYKHIYYNLNLMQQSADLDLNPIMINSYASLINCTPVDRASNLMMVLSLSHSF